jgi:hypothetical protein
VTLFYEGPCARITHEAFEVRYPYPQSFAIPDLRYVHMVRARSEHVGALASAPIKICSTAMCGVSAFTLAGTWPSYQYPVMSGAAFVVLVASTVVATLAWRVRAAYELRALHHGQLVCLVRTTDRHAFNQISRALFRVIERLDDGG